MVVDQKPFLKKALARCQRVRRDLAKRQKVLATFEDDDLPAYQAWLATEFGALLTRIREEQETVADLDLWCYHIDFAVEMIGVPPNEVYEYVHKHREDPDYRDPRYDPDPGTMEGNPDREAGADFEARFEDMAEDEREIIEEILKEMAEELGIDPKEMEKEPGFPGWSPGKNAARPLTPTKQNQAVNELKQLYRKLARRVHPDVSDMDHSIAQRRWEQLQEAYEAKDLDKLKALEAICDADESGLSIQLGLAHLSTWADYHHQLLKPLQSAMRAAKKHPAWGFSALGQRELSRHRNEVEEELRHEYNKLRLRRLNLGKQLDSYRRRGDDNPTRSIKRSTKTKGNPKQKAKQKPTIDPQPDENASSPDQQYFDF